MYVNFAVINYAVEELGAKEKSDDQPICLKGMDQ